MGVAEREFSRVLNKAGENHQINHEVDVINLKIEFELFIETLMNKKIIIKY